MAASFADLVPEARVAVAHGQMDEGTLEQVVLDFWEGRYDVLVCTTIIESGIDMPTVNTLVVDRADLLGLGQLHQLRGRVGRAGQRGLRLPVPSPRPGAHRAGLRAAADDRRAHRARLGLQDRHARPRDPRRRQPARRATSPGHIAAVGYDLYVQMVAEAVAEPKGERPGRRAEVKLDLPVDAHLPADYVAARGPAARGLPAAGGGPAARGGRRHRRRVGRPLRAAAPGRRGACSRWPGSGPTACGSA